MKKIISFVRKSGENSGFMGLPMFLFRLFAVFLFISQSTLLSAQDHVTTQNGESPSVLSVKGGGLIFSTDENFNHQILEKKIIVADSKIAYTIHRGSTQLIVSHIPYKIQSGKKFAGSLQDAAKQKTRDELKKITKEIAKFEEGKKRFQNKNINIPLSSSQFFTVESTTKNYVAPSSQNGIEKITGTAHHSIHQNALDFLHSKIDDNYHIHSPGYYFSAIYSIRPPPLLI